MSRSLLARSVVVGLLLIAGVFIWVQLGAGLDYRYTVSGEDLLLLAFAAGLVSTCVVVYGLISCALLGWLEPQSSQGPGRLRLFLYTWPLRYIPGTVPYHASRVLLADKIGVSKSTVAASLFYENLLLLGASGFVGIAGLLTGLGLATSTYVPYVIVGLLIACLPLLLQPRILLPIATVLLRILNREPPPAASMLSARRTLIVFSIYTMTHCLQGTAFFLVAHSVSDSAPNLPLAAGAYVLAAGVGMVALFVPSGLGVREGVIVALVAGVMSSEAALIAAGLARVVSTLADVIPVLCLSGSELTKAAWRWNLARTRSGTVPKQRHV